MPNRGGTLRVALVAALFACVGLVLASPASAVRSKRGAKPSITILTKDAPAALKAKALSLRVGIGKPPARVRLRGLGLNLGPRPIRIVEERKVRFRRAGSRTYNLRLSKEARRSIQAAIAACRDVRVSAFAASRRYGSKRDDQRTTLVRHSKTLKHGRKSGCGRTPGVPGSPGSTPGLGGPGLDPPGTQPPPAPPVPTDPITIRAGSAESDSTPPVGTPMFAYTARSNIFGPDVNRPLQILADPDENLYAKTFAPSQGIHTRIRARAIVLEGGGKKFALAMVDLGGHPYAFNKAVEERIAATGIPGERLMISSTHTHSSSGAIWSADNSGYGLVGGDVYDPRVFEMVVSGVVEAIVEANKRLQPARVGIGSAMLRGASRNREHDPFKRNPDAPAEEKADNNLAVDQRVAVIRVDNARGEPLGVWSNFAIHPTSFGDDNLLFSGDNAATTERLVEDELVRDYAATRGAAPTTDPVNVWTNGTEGDVSPDGGVQRDPTLPGNDPHSELEHSKTAPGFGSANSAGRKVAAGIVNAWRDAGARMSGSPALDARRTFLKLTDAEAEGGRTALQPVLGAGGIVAEEGPEPIPAGGCAPFDDFSGPGQGKKFPVTGSDLAVPAVHPVSLMRVGPLALVTYPSEITTVAGRRIKKAIADTAGAEAPAGAVIAGMTNSYNSYTATPEEYDHCSYQGSFTLWGRRQSLLYRQAAGGLARSLYGGQAAPPSAPEPPTPSPGTPNQPSLRTTPRAGDTLAQPAATVKRLGLASYRWAGGDPAIDAPRGKTFVTLEYRPGSSGPFRAVATEDSVMDTTQHAADDSWTETWQFSECDAVGQYRFVVRGRAVKDGPPPSDYTATSNAFTLAPATIKSYSATVSGGVARVRAEYTGLPSNALATLARRVRHGFAVLKVTRPDGVVDEVIAPIDSRGLEFRASVPDGSTVSVLSIEDACGNTGS